jgi:hypothetical protein
MMRFRHIPLVALVVAALAVGAGSCNATGAAPSTCEFLPGDLVITEIMADPDGADGGNEWFELYNATVAELTLAGLTVEVVGGRGSKVHLIQASIAPTVPANGYLALGDGVVGNNNLGYSYGTALGAFPNEAGTIIVRCGTSEIDRVDYGAGAAGPGAPSSGKALQLTGTQTPEYHANDVAASWCDATELMGDGVNSGTPGAQNTPCATSGCDDGMGGLRPLRLPQVGELVLTEILSNSPGTEDHAKEWIEILNTTSTQVDLLGVEVLYGASCQTATQITGGGCITVPAGGYLVLAGNVDPGLNGGVIAAASFGGSGLINDDGCVALRVKETGIVIDQATYGQSTDGHAFSLDPAKLDAALNDDPASWCVAGVPYGSASGFGTPGLENPACGTSGCDDGAGGTRPARVPQPGELVISEIMSNSPGTEDHKKEWIEVYNTTAEAIDLLGVQVLYGATCQSAADVVGTGCITVPAAEYVVLAGSADSAVNGGLPAVLATFAGSGLLNDTGCVALRVTASQVEIDRATYTASTDGKAFSLDPSKLTATDNDLAANWCVATLAYGSAGGYGTPGAANPACGVTYCNDGGSPRAAVAPAVGAVFVTEVFANPTGADTPAKEWFEVYVTQACDLNGLKITNGNGTSTRVWTLASSDCIGVTAGSYVVIAGSADTGLNGGLPQTGVYAIASLSLYNTGTPLTLTLEAGGQVVDTASFPTPPDGKSVSLSPAQLTAAGNDTAANFCTSKTTTVFTGTGTPGQANDSCP